VVYGARPLDPLTWDADRIFGCAPDRYGFARNATINITSPVASSYLSDTYECVPGYDVRLLDRVSAKANFTHFATQIQTLTCNARDGSFRLYFRGITTASLAFNTSLTSLRDALQGLSTVGRVIVSSAGGLMTSPVCSYYHTQPVNITFLDTLGLLPLLTPVNMAFRENDYMDITRANQGAVRGLAECAGRGDCNRALGICVCQPGRRSSDGFGEEGLRPDCGFNSIE
jgi:hypothetical protein